MVGSLEPINTVQSRQTRVCLRTRLRTRRVGNPQTPFGVQTRKGRGTSEDSIDKVDSTTLVYFDKTFNFLALWLFLLTSCEPLLALQVWHQRVGQAFDQSVRF